MNREISDHCSNVNAASHHFFFLVVFTHRHISSIIAILILKIQKVVKYSTALLFEICHTVSFNLVSLICSFNIIAAAKVP